jgi:hypothetical protein
MSREKGIYKMRTSDGKKRNNDLICSRRGGREEITPKTRSGNICALDRSFSNKNIAISCDRCYNKENVVRACVCARGLEGAAGRKGDGSERERERERKKERKRESRVVVHVVKKKNPRRTIIRCPANNVIMAQLRITLVAFGSRYPRAPRPYPCEPPFARAGLRGAKGARECERGLAGPREAEHRGKDARARVSRSRRRGARARACVRACVRAMGSRALICLRGEGGRVPVPGGGARGKSAGRTFARAIRRRFRGGRAGRGRGTRGTRRRAVGRRSSTDGAQSNVAGIKGAAARFFTQFSGASSSVKVRSVASGPLPPPRAAPSRSFGSACLRIALIFPLPSPCAIASSLLHACTSRSLFSPAPAILLTTTPTTTWSSSFSSTSSSGTCFAGTARVHVCMRACVCFAWCRAPVTWGREYW